MAVNVLIKQTVHVFRLTQLYDILLYFYCTICTGIFNFFVNIGLIMVH